MKNKEVELKVLISRQDLRKLLNTSFMKEAIVENSKQKRKLVSSYYDTEDLSFKKKGIAYRVRDKGDGTFEATIKTGKKNQGGITERIEINIPLEKDEAVLDGFGNLGLGYELSELAPDGVKKLFTVDVERTTYDLEFEGATFEIAVDKGRITSELTKNKDKIDEMEIEIKEGAVEKLLKLAALISQTVPIFVEPRSKFARGLAILGKDSTYPIVKRKMGAAPIRSELLEVFSLKGNTALALQNDLLKNGLRNDALKSLTKQLKFMLSYVLLAREVDGKWHSDEYINLLIEIINDIYGVLDLYNIYSLWGTVDLEKKIFSKSNMADTILDNIDGAEILLLSKLNLGRLTAIFYGVQSILASEEWDNEEYMEATVVARGVLKKWQENLNLVNSSKESLWLADDIIYLARSIDAKFADKLASDFKKKRNFLAAEALNERMEQRLACMLKESKSKYLYRDIGVLLGLIMAKGNK